MFSETRKCLKRGFYFVTRFSPWWHCLKAHLFLIKIRFWRKIKSSLGLLPEEKGGDVGSSPFSFGRVCPPSQREVRTMQNERVEAQRGSQNPQKTDEGESQEIEGRWEGMMGIESPASTSRLWGKLVEPWQPTQWPRTGNTSQQGSGHTTQWPPVRTNEWIIVHPQNGVILALKGRKD